jgi:hypothetical protein
MPRLWSPLAVLALRQQTSRKASSLPQQTNHSQQQRRLQSGECGEEVELEAADGPQQQSARE